MGQYADALLASAQSLIPTTPATREEDLLTGPELLAIIGKMHSAVAFLEGLQRGAKILKGTTAPGPGIGLDGDAYFNTTTRDLYASKENGAWGTPTSLKGKDGKDGKDGEDGEDGSNGKDAYQEWRDLGYIGTKADFINWLKGKDGVDGEDGAPGNTQYWQSYAPTVELSSRAGDVWIHTLSEEKYALYEYLGSELNGVGARVGSWRKRFVTPGGGIAAVLPEQNDTTVGKVLTSDGKKASWEQGNGTGTGLPPQSATTEGKFLRSNGTLATWQSIRAFESASINANNLILTRGDGTNQSVPLPGSTITYAAAIAWTATDSRSIKEVVEALNTAALTATRVQKERIDALLSGAPEDFDTFFEAFTNWTADHQQISNILDTQAAHGQQLNALLTYIPAGTNASDKKLVNEASTRLLPAVTAANNGKVLKVMGGVWGLGDDNGNGSGGVAQNAFRRIVYQATASGAQSIPLGGTDVLDVFVAVLPVGLDNFTTLDNYPAGKMTIQGDQLVITEAGKIQKDDVLIIRALVGNIVGGGGGGTPYDDAPIKERITALEGTAPTADQKSALGGGAYYANSLNPYTTQAALDALIKRGSGSNSVVLLSGFSFTTVTGAFAFSAGREGDATAAHASVIGYSNRALTNSSFATGHVTECRPNGRGPDGTWGQYAGGSGAGRKTTLVAGSKPIISQGQSAFNHSTNFGDQPADLGARADYSGILGGVNADVPEGCDGVVLLGSNYSRVPTNTKPDGSGTPVRYMAVSPQFMVLQPGGAVWLPAPNGTFGAITLNNDMKICLNGVPIH